MNIRSGRGDAVVISAYWPGISGGAPLCTNSELRSAAKFFHRVHLVYIGPHLDDPDRAVDQLPARVEATLLTRRVPPPLHSFAASLASRLPAVAHRYSRIDVDLEEKLQEFHELADDQPLSVIFDDVPPAVLLDRIRRRLPEARIAIRSHNLMTRAFVGIERNQMIHERVAWGIERRKIRSFERRVCRRADRLWAISQAEAERYRELLGVRVHGVFGIGLDACRYLDVPFGEPRTAVHLGRLDMRKGRGMKEFLRKGWPLVRRAEPRANLLIAGRGSKELTNAAIGVQGLGIVENDTEFLARGGIFLNPQIVGAGVQIKNAVALLAGKALVSTSMAAEGLDGSDGIHYLIGDSSKALARKILELMPDNERSREMGQTGRSLAARVFDRQRVENQAFSLFQDLVTAKR